MNSRRQFLVHAPLGLLSAVAACSGDGKQAAASAAQATPGAPPTFGAAPAVGPEVSPGTFAEAEKLVQIELSGAEREMAAASWRASMAALYERRTGPRKVALDAELAPATRWIPVGAAEHAAGSSPPFQPHRNRPRAASGER